MRPKPEAKALPTMVLNKKREFGEQAPPFGDSLPFEVVSFDQAREALDAVPAGVQALQRPSLDWAARRRNLSEAERRLSRAATQWMLSLPKELRPLELMRRYPRIANRLCDCWGDAALSLQVLDELVMDRRGNRQGFPRPVAIELQALSVHLQRTLRQSRR
jgi:hypothetical protein